MLAAKSSRQSVERHHDAQTYGAPIESHVAAIGAS